MNTTRTRLEMPARIALARKLEAAAIPNDQGVRYGAAARDVFGTQDVESLVVLRDEAIEKSIRWNERAREYINPPAIRLALTIAKECADIAGILHAALMELGAAGR